MTLEELKINLKDVIENIHYFKVDSKFVQDMAKDCLDHIIELENAIKTDAVKNN